MPQLSLDPGSAVVCLPSGEEGGSHAEGDTDALPVIDQDGSGRLPGFDIGREPAAVEGPGEDSQQV